MSRSWSTTFAMVPFGGEYITSYSMAVVMCALSLIIYEIFAKHIKRQKFDLEGRCQGEKLDLRHSIGNDPNLLSI